MPAHFFKYHIEFTAVQHYVLLKTEDSELVLFRTRNEIAAVVFQGLPILKNRRFIWPLSKILDPSLVINIRETRKFNCKINLNAHKQSSPRSIISSTLFLICTLTEPIMTQNNNLTKLSATGNCYLIFYGKIMIISPSG